MQYDKLLEILKSQNSQTSIDQRKQFAGEAFQISSGYDSSIYGFFAGNNPDYFKSDDDLYYIENWSLILDLKIMLKTIAIIFTDKQAY